jgi:hypothetical protein
LLGTAPAWLPGNIVIATHGTVPKTMPTSARDMRQAHDGAGPTRRRRRAIAHTVTAANGNAATVMNTIPVYVPNQLYESSMVE